MRMLFPLTLAAATAAGLYWHTARPGDAPPAPLPEAGARPPASLAFEPNVGQTADEVRYLARGKGYALFFTDASVVARLAPAADGTRASDVIAMTLANANASPRISAERPQPGTSSYITGSDPSGWHRGVPHYAQLRYSDVYAGIDAVYYGREGELEYDFEVAPGADPGVIALDFSGVDGLSIDARGDLVLGTDGGALVQHRPVVYQVVDGTRQVVEAAYRLVDADTVGFVLGAFDAALPLVIDPVLSYSTYLGGDAFDSASLLQVDAAGNLWMAGTTGSVVFPWDSDPEDAPVDGFLDAYVCRMAAMGARPDCAYIGGSDDDYAGGLAIGPDGQAVVTGQTSSPDFPQFPVPASLQGSSDAFVLKINATADGLDFSTLLGGMYSEFSSAVAVDSSNAIFVGGSTSSPDFPTTPGALQTSIINGAGFVVRYDATGNRERATYLAGGNGPSAVLGLALDADGDPVVAGYTQATDFPVAGAVQPTHGGNTDAFVARLDRDLGSLGFSTFFGGAGDDYAAPVAIDRTGKIVIAGDTESPDFPTHAALQSSFAGDYDGFVAQLSADGGDVLFSTYMGGSGNDGFTDLDLDPAGNIHATGFTSSTDYPLDDNLFPGATGENGVLVKLSATGQALAYATLLGGSGEDYTQAGAVDGNGDVFVAGYTQSGDLTVVRPFQAAPGADFTQPDTGDVLLARISESALRHWAGDFNGDGKDDILWRNDGTGQSSIWYSANSAGAVNLPRVANLDWRIVGVGDFNGDAKSDVVWRNRTTGANVIWRSANAATPQTTRSVTNTNWQVHAIGDFDGDGMDDLVWHQTMTGQTAIWYEGNAATATNLVLVGNLGWDIVGAGDFNGDGTADLLWRNPSAGQNAIWSGGDYRVQLPIGAVSGQSWQIVGIGDFQGDGKDDLLWRNLAQGANTLWNGGSSANAQAIARLGNPKWNAAGVADYNGDGKADILWRDALGGNNTIWRSGSSATPQGVTGVTNMAWSPRS